MKTYSYWGKANFPLIKKHSDQLSIKVFISNNPAIKDDPSQAFNNRFIVLEANEDVHLSNKTDNNLLNDMESSCDCDIDVFNMNLRCIKDDNEQLQVAPAHMGKRHLVDTTIYFSTESDIVEGAVGGETLIHEVEVDVGSVGALVSETPPLETVAKRKIDVNLVATELITMLSPLTTQSFTFG